LKRSREIEMRSIDFALAGGWHATVFLSWVSLTILVVLAVAFVWLLKTTVLARR
jgi:hypothetical protein